MHILLEVWLMSLRSLLSPTVLTIAAILAGTGCHGSFVYYDDGHTTTKRRVQRGHVHVKTCHDCYYDGPRLIVLTGHRHGPGCGHVWNGRHWVVARKAPAKKRVGVYTKGHSDRYWNGKKYVIIKGHRHGPGCGHVWNGKHWVTAGKKKDSSKAKAKTKVKTKGKTKARSQPQKDPSKKKGSPPN